MTAFDDVPVLATAQPATRSSFFLAEGPTWDAANDLLYWVDIMAGDVHTGVLRSDGTIDERESIHFPDTAGAVALSSSGELLVAGEHRLYRRDSSGTIVAGPALVAGEERRFNDAKADPAGRYLAGTKGPGPEVLLSVDGGSRTIDGDLQLSNGLGWTSDERTLYTIDSPSGQIYVRSYDPETGQTGERREFLRIDGVFLDGMTVDADDHLWVAVWGGGTILRVSPDAEIVGRVVVPGAPHTSCPAFAGPDLDTLVITTARENMTDEALAANPDSGKLFTAKVGVRGVPPYQWDPERVFAA